ncbi:MAG: hypothetical protein ACKPGI_09630, partial [Verrucomicrobiota bacterium]
LGGFIVKAAPKLGVHLLQTISLPSIPGRWHYQARPDELAIVVEGDCSGLLHLRLAVEGLRELVGFLTGLGPRSALKLPVYGGQEHPS